PGAPVHALRAARPARSGAPRRRRRAAHLLVGGDAAGAPNPGHAGDVHVHVDVERFHVADDRPLRSGALHAPSGAGESLRRARAGHRADDGRRGGDGAASAGAVRSAAAVLHRGADGRKREGMKGRRQKAEGRSGLAVVLTSAFCLLPSAFAADIAWTAHPSDGVTLSLTREGAINKAAFDFRGHGGYAIARRSIDADLLPNYQFVFRIRAEAPPENLEFKLISGDNVWWLNRRDFVFLRAWT